MINYKLTLAYDGRRLKGFKKTKAYDDRTVQGKLESILYKLYDANIEVISAVNTDAGVNAKEQVVNFQVPDGGLDSKGIFNYFEEYLPDDIVLLSIKAVEDRFHSRYLLKTITYEYRLWKKDANHRPLFERQLVNTMKDVLDTSLMKDAASKLIGSHDFTAFSGKNKVKSPVKQIEAIEVEETANEIIIKMEANSFLLNMERIIVGTLIQIGTGQKKVSTIDKAFESCKKEDVGHKAMAHALSLVSVQY